MQTAPSTTESSGRALVFRSLAAGIAPARRIGPVEWAEKNLVVPDGPYAGQLWRRELTPYVVEPLGHLAADSTTTCVTVRASAQVSKTLMGLIWLGYVIDVCPANMLVVFPTIKSLYDFNATKLQPCLDASPGLRRKVIDQKSRSGRTSTTFNKRYPGGVAVLTCANSPSDLRSKTAQFVFCDEIDEWEKNLALQGDPMMMVDARQQSFQATGDYKKFQCSTPTLAGSSRIDKEFERGDQRFWHMPCPHCGEYQRLRFSKERFRFEREYPYNARYACEYCGSVIEHFEKAGMLARGKWVPTAPGPGKHPSYHIDTLMSPLVNWDWIAAKFWETKDDQQKFKGFVNLTLGESYRVQTDAPPIERLLALREDYEHGRLPPGALVITGGADVQKNGIYYEVVAWGAGKTSWSVDYGFLPGETADEFGPVWKALDEIRGRKYPDAYGNVWGIDAFGVDSRYNSGAVYAWVRRWPEHGTYAVQGEDGWSRPAISTPVKKEVDWRGQKKRRGLSSWPVGTYLLKAEFYGALKKKGMKEGEAFDPPGYCHFALWHDEHFFQQVTAEYVGEVANKNGYVERRWKKPSDRDNHLLDCRVYAMAMAERVSFKGKIGVSRWSDDDWRELAAVRSVPPAKVQEDLFGRLGVAEPAAAKAEPGQHKQPPEPPRGSFLPKRNNFLRRK